MILFPDDVQAINELLQQLAGLASELIEASREHIELGQYDVAVFKAFRILEGRIQHRSGIQGESASKTLNQALSSRGPLTRKLGFTPRQAANFRDLLQAAFAVFRNPEAHPQEALIEYGSAECRAVLAFVNLMLGVLNRQPDDPLQAALKQIRRDVEVDATERLGEFLERVRTLDLETVQRTQSFSFRAWSLRATQRDVPPKRIRTTVFYLAPEAGNPYLAFRVWQWSPVVGFEAQAHVDRLKALDCVEIAKPSEPRFELYLRDHNSAEMFAQLYVVVRDIVEEMEQSLTARGEKG